MAGYRLYFTDNQGHIGHAIELDCRDDAHAIEMTEQHRDGRAMELWQRDRLVRRFEPT